ncbi:hypothetical protein MMC07_003491 [Pseudocyphellaria aurata]|nr:hypothetical protein [Pseudocyphellaria aurata]
MPGKASARNPRTSRLPRKSSAQTIASRKSTALRISTPTIVIPEEGPTSTLRTRICDIFSAAQRTTAGHRKLVVGLRKIQETCCYEQSNSQGQNNFGEDDFNMELARCVIRLMVVKKTENVGDRIVRYLGLFLRHASEKDAAIVPKSDVEEESQSFTETPTTRLTSHILSITLPLLASKEKTVRYRSTQLVAHIINSLDSIDEENFHLLKLGLSKRVRDKESMIRVQAVLGLGRLAGNGDDMDPENTDSDDDVVSGLLEKLLEILQNDPSADVRRSLLLNLPLTPTTLPYLLERARDLDPATRRALYSRLLPALGDFRHLSLSMREKLLRWGLRDRDESVRKATARLFRERWIEDCAGPRNMPEESKPGASGAPGPANVDGLLELLERLDVVNSAVEDGVALEAMKEFWSGRPDYRDEINFDDAFWEHLTPESTFMARSFNDFCKQEGEGKFEIFIEEKMPEVTKLAFFLERYTNHLVDVLRSNETRNEGEEEDTVEQEFVVEQLLQIAKTLNYSDEVGRRKMFALLRETLAIAELPDDITKLVVDVLRDVCGIEASGERDFCGVVLEAVAEVHDTILADEVVPENEDESFHSARSEISDSTPTTEGKKQSRAKESTDDGEDEVNAIREIMVNMKCLHIAQCMLQNVEGSLQNNLHLVTMLNNLVVPANLAEENLTLFLHCYNKGHETLQETALHVLSDILATHPSLVSLQSSDAALLRSVSKIFSKAIKATQAIDVQSAAIIALCKLMLTGVIQDDDLLKQAVIAFFDPATKDNAVLRQALSYFLPVFCHSRRENMEKMASVAPSVIHAVLSFVEELDEEEEIVGVGAVGNMLLDWTDARKLVVQDEFSVSWDEAGRKEIKAVNGDIHLDLAEQLLEKVMSHGCTKEEKKAIIPLLGKLYITANSTREKLQVIYELVTKAIDMKEASDATSRNALSKLLLALEKAIGEVGTTERNAEAETVVIKRCIEV